MVVLVGLGAPRREQVREIGERRGELAAREAQPVLHLGAGLHQGLVPHPGLGAGALRVHGLEPRIDDALVEAVLEIPGLPDIPELRRVGLVFREQELRDALRVQNLHAQVIRLDADAARERAQLRLGGAGVPAPGIAQHQLRNEVQGRGVRAAIPGRDQHQDVAGLDLSVLDEHIEVAVLARTPRCR